jgi:hypothetical protein
MEGQEIGPSEASTYAGQHEHKGNANVGIHALSGIRTHNFDLLKKVCASLTLHGHCDQHEHARYLGPKHSVRYRHIASLFYQLHGMASNYMLRACG